MWKVLSVLILTIWGLNGLPISQDKELSEELPTLATELLPPRPDAEERNFGVDIFNENVTLATELLPPFEDVKGKLGVVYIINLYAVRNTSGEDAEEVLSNDVMDKIPGILEPVATVLLILEEDDESKPVSLDEFAKDLEEEGFKVEKIGEDKETKVIKVDMDGSEDPDVELIKPGKLNKIRRRRSPEPHPHLISKLLNKYGGGGGGCDVCQGGGHGGGYPSGNGGGSTIGVIPIYVVPVSGGGGGYHQSPPQQHYQPQPQYYQPQPQQYHPQPQQNYQQPCNVCGGSGGNHGSESHSSAQASAQSSSNSW